MITQITFDHANKIIKHLTDNGVATLRELADATDIHFIYIKEAIDYLIDENYVTWNADGEVYGDWKPRYYLRKDKEIQND
jgi:transcription initiation factor IIE alpha subunit